MPPDELLMHAGAEMVRLWTKYEEASIAALMAELNMRGKANIEKARRRAAAIRGEYDIAVAKWRLLGGRFI